MPDKFIPSDKSQVLVPASHFSAEPRPPVGYPEQAHFGHIPESKNPALNAARQLLQSPQERDINRLNQLRLFSAQIAKAEALRPTKH